MRDQKELLRTVIEEVIITAPREEQRAYLVVRWRGGELTELDIPRPRKRKATIRTDEETVDLIRRLATHYPDAIIAGILNRQGKTTAFGHRFTANHVGNTRRHWGIDRFVPSTPHESAPLVSIHQAAAMLDIAPSTLHRWVNDGFVAGEQITPGAPWQIRMTNELRQRFVERAPAGYVPMQDATKRLGVSRQTVLQRVKRGKLDAVHVYQGKRKGLRIKVPNDHYDLFPDSP